jgi:hypothetical protein
MKNFIRRFTSSRALDRIDEMDETDPFGAGWHHGGPYEAIGSNLAQLGPAHMYNDIDVLRGDFHTKSKREVGWTCKLFATHIYILFAKNAPRHVRIKKVCLVVENEAFIFTCFAAAAPQIASSWFSWTVSKFCSWANCSIWYYIAASAYRSGQQYYSEP